MLTNPYLRALSQPDVLSSLNLLVYSTRISTNNMAAITVGTQAPVPADALDAWNGAPNNEPIYIIKRQRITDVQCHAVCIVTDANMDINRQANRGDARRWANRSKPAGPGPGPMRAYLNANYPAPLAVGSVVEAPGDLPRGAGE